MDQKKTTVIENSLPVARAIWESLSSQANIYDSFDYRASFFDKDTHEILFLTTYISGEPRACLPLQRNKLSGAIHFFGGPFMERNHVLLKSAEDENAGLALYQSTQLPDSIVLDDIASIDPISKFSVPNDPAYILELNNVSTISEYLSRLSNDMRKDILRVEKRFLEKQYSVVFAKDMTVTKSLAEQSVKRFSGESWFAADAFTKGFHNLFNTDLDTLTLDIRSNEKSVASAICIDHKNVFYYLMGASSRDIPGLGRYLNLTVINEAIRRKSISIDSGIGECGWKDKWGFSDKALQYKFTRTPIH